MRLRRLLCRPRPIPTPLLHKRISITTLNLSTLRCRLDRPPIDQPLLTLNTEGTAAALWAPDERMTIQSRAQSLTISQTRNPLHVPRRGARHGRDDRPDLPERARVRARPGPRPLQVPRAPRTGVAAADATAAATGAAEPPQPPLRLQGRRVLPRGLQAQGRLGARRLAREVSRPRSTRSPTA